jgi:hypothetical protein
MIKASSFQKPFGLSLLPVYILVSFFSSLTLSEKQITPEGFSNEVSQNINLEPSPQNFTTTSLNISKPVSSFLSDILQRTDNKISEVKTNYYLSKVQKIEQFTSSGALYLFNKVLIH